MWKKIHLNKEGQFVSYATALVLLVIDELSDHGEKLTYGYEIMAHLRNTYKWDVKSGTIYPILKKLKSDGLIKLEHHKLATNRNQFFYLITKKGQQLVEEIKKFQDISWDKIQMTEMTQKELENVISDNDYLLNFSLKNFADEILTPFFEKLHKLIFIGLSNTIKEEEREQIKSQFVKTIEEFDKNKKKIEILRGLLDNK